MQLNRHNVKVFSKEWFELHQNLFLGMLNSKVIGELFRSLLNIDTSNRIVKVSPNSFHWLNEDLTISAKCYSSEFIVKGLINNFSVVFNLMHEWDKLAKWSERFFGQKYLKYDFGFSTLTAYQFAGSGGALEFYSADTNGNTFAYIRTPNASPSADSGGQYIGVWASTTTVNNYWIICHPYYKCDTSSIGSTGTVTSASLNFYPSAGDSASVAGYAHSACVYSGAGSGGQGSSQWVNNTWTRYSDSGTDISMTTMIGRKGTQYEIISLNATGLTALSKTGYSHVYLGINKLVDNTGFTWQGTSQYDKMTINTETAVGTANDPYLSVTYTPGASTNRNLAGVTL